MVNRKNIKNALFSIILALLLINLVYGAQQNPLLNNFTAGEVSPKMDARSDIVPYANGAKKIENFAVMPYGGLTRVSGTYFVCSVKTPEDETRLIPFQFSTTQTYVLEFGDEYIRFYKDDGQIQDGGSPYEITSPYDKTDLFELNFAQDADTMYITHNDYPIQKLTRSGHTDWRLTPFLPSNLVESGFGISYNTYDSANAWDGSTATWAQFNASGAYVGQDFGVGNEKNIVKIKVNANTGLGCQFSLQYSDDDITYTNTTIVAQTILAGSGWNSFTCTSVGAHRYWRMIDTAAVGKFNEFELYEGDANWVMPFLPENKTNTTLTPSATSGSITLTASSGIFTADYVGTMFKLLDGIVLVTGYTSATVLDCSVINDLSGTTATTEWSEGSWSKVRGYPSCGTFYEQRLFFAGTASQPQTVWGSQINNFENFETGAEDDDALDYTIASNQVNAIEWLSASKVLTAGTSGGIFTISSGSSNEPLTPSNVVVHRESTIGCSSLPPKKIDTFTYFVQRNNRTIRQFAYSYDVDSYVALNKTILSEHITDSGIVELDYQQSPYNILWCVRDDGEIALMTRQTEHEVSAWTRVVTNGEFESVAVIPNGEEDQVWVIVNRDNDGSTGRYIEYFMPFEFDNEESAFFVHSGLSYRGSPTTTVNGLNHLEGKDVYVYADNESIGSFTVSSGSITLTSSASVIHAGLPYTSEFKSLRIEAGATKGTAQGQTGRVYQIVVRYLQSHSFKYGNGSTFYDVSATYSTDSADTRLLAMPSGWNTDKYIGLKTSTASPLTVLGIFPRIETND